MTVLKPGFSTLIVYVPGGREGKKYPPASLVTTTRVALVPAFVKVTVAPWTVAPLESCASPPIEPNVWPNATWFARKIHPNTNSRIRIPIPLTPSIPHRETDHVSSPDSLVIENYHSGCMENAYPGVGCPPN